MYADRHRLGNENGRLIPPLCGMSNALAVRPLHNRVKIAKRRNYRNGFGRQSEKKLCAVGGVKLEVGENALKRVHLGCIECSITY